MYSIANLLQHRMRFFKGMNPFTTLLRYSLLTDTKPTFHTTTSKELSPRNWKPAFTFSAAQLSSKCTRQKPIALTRCSPNFRRECGRRMVKHWNRLRRFKWCLRIIPCAPIRMTPVTRSACIARLPEPFPQASFISLKTNLAFIAFFVPVRRAVIPLAMRWHSTSGEHTTKKQPGGHRHSASSRRAERIRNLSHSASREHAIPRRQVLLPGRFDRKNRFRRRDDRSLRWSSAGASAQSHGRRV